MFYFQIERRRILNSKSHSSYDTSQLRPLRPRIMRSFFEMYCNFSTMRIPRRTFSRFGDFLALFFSWGIPHATSYILTIHLLLSSRPRESAPESEVVRFGCSHRVMAVVAPVTSPNELFREPPRVRALVPVYFFQFFSLP